MDEVIMVAEELVPAVARALPEGEYKVLRSHTGSLSVVCVREGAESWRVLQSLPPTHRCRTRTLSVCDDQQVTVGRRAHRRHVPARVGRGARARGEAVPSFRVQLAGAGHDPAVVGLRHVLSSRMYSLQVVSAGNDITGSDLPGDDDSYWHWLAQMHVSDFKRFLLDASSSREQDTMQQVTASAASYPFKTNFQEVVSTGTKLTGDDLPGVCKFRRSSGSLCAATASSSVSSVSSVRQPTRETDRPRLRPFGVLPGLRATHR